MYYPELLGRLESLPGVELVSLANPAPLQPVPMTVTLSVFGQMGQDQELTVNVNYVSPRYFETVELPFLIGRDFSEQDTAIDPSVAIINDSTARRLFSGTNPIGRQLILQSKQNVRIIGVVKDSKYRSMREQGSYAIFLSSWQHAMRARHSVLVIRTAGAPYDLVPDLRRQVEALGRESILMVSTLEDAIARSLILERMLATVSGFFGLLSLLIVCIGVYGVIASSMAQRAREIAMRIVLGASSKDIRKLVFREAGVVILPGTTVGLLAAEGISRIASSMFFGLDAADYTMFLVASVFLFVVSLSSVYIPSMRYCAMEPMTVLRI